MRIRQQLLQHVASSLLPLTAFLNISAHGQTPLSHNRAPDSSGQQNASSGVNASSTTTTPSALVTFYSNYMSLEGGLPKEKGGAFRGRLFSDDDQIAFMEPGHFVTISFIPGHYTFTLGAWFATVPIGGDHLDIDIVDGHHYFLEAGGRTLMVPSLYTIRQVTCQEATARNTKAKPLEAKHLGREAAQYAISESSFPACP